MARCAIAQAELHRDQPEHLMPVASTSSPMTSRLPSGTHEAIVATWFESATGPVV